MREDWVDVAKGLGIVLVVIGHHVGSRSSVPYVAEIIYLFHLPLFFFLTGITLRKEFCAPYILHRFIAVVRPYFIVAISVALLASILHGESLSALILGVVYGVSSTLTIGILWYFTCLALTLVLSLVIIMLLRRFVVARFMNVCLGFISMLLIIGGAYTLDFGRSFNFSNPYAMDSGAIGLPWNIDITIITTGFMLLGQFVALLKIVERVHWLSSFYLALLLGALVVLMHHAGARLDLNMRIIQSPLMSLIASISGLFMSVFIAKVFLKNKYIKNCFILVGQSSLVIFCFHTVLLALFARILPGVLPEFLVIAVGIILSIVILIYVDLRAIRKVALARYSFYGLSKVYKIR